MQRIDESRAGEPSPHDSDSIENKLNCEALGALRFQPGRVPAGVRNYHRGWTGQWFSSFFALILCTNVFHFGSFVDRTDRYRQ